MTGREWSREHTGWGLVSTHAQDVQWTEEPHAAEGLACMTCPMWVKAGQLGGPRGEITFLTFPMAGAGASAQMTAQG